MVKSVLSNWMTLAIASVLSLVITPVLVGHLGPAGYGMWVLTGSIIDYYGLLDMGMRGALFRFAARFKGSGSRESLDQTFASASSFAIGISALITLSIPTVVVFAPRLLKLNGSELSQFRLVVCFMGLAMAAMFVSRTLCTFASSLGRFDLANLADSSTIVLRTVGIYLVLRMGFGIIAVSVAVLSSSIYFLLSAYVIVKWADPELRMILTQARWSRLKELASFSAFTSMNSLGDYFRFYTDSIVITRMLSVALVTPFSIANKLMSYLQSLIIGFGAPVNALFNTLDAQRKEDELRTYFLRATRIAAVMTLLVALILAIDGGSFLTLWIGHDMKLSSQVLHILIIGYVAELSQHPCVLLLIARGRQKTLGFLSIAEGLINLLLSVALARKYGVLGVAWGTAVPMVMFRSLVYPMIVTRILGMPFSEYFFSALGRPLAVAVAAVAVARVIAIPSALNWQQLALNTSWQTIALLFAFVAFALQVQDWNYLKQRLHTVIQRRQSPSVEIA